MMGLTSRQRDLLAFLRDEQLAGRSPSLDDMGEALGLRSKSGVWRLVNGLEERGYIRRLPNRARAIELVEQRQAVLNPEIAAAVADYARSQVIGFDTAVNELLRMSVGPQA